MLSVIIIAKNESLHIERCLRSVSWVDEIIVLDSGSTDNTVELCSKYTPHVYRTDWPGFGPQKQRALNKATKKWILSLDADELVSEDLKQDILAAIKHDNTIGFHIPRLSSYCGRQIKHGGWWPDYVLRLFQREHGQFSTDIVHEQVLVEGKTEKLHNPILHDAFVDPIEVLNKINNYSTLGAQKLFDSGKRTNLLQVISKGLWSFFKTYFIKAAFLDGAQGFMLSISNAEGTYYKYLKLLDLQRQQHK